MNLESRTPWQLTRLMMILCWLVWILTFFITITLFQAVLQIRVVAQVAQAPDKAFISFNEDLMYFVPMDSVTEHTKNVWDEMIIRYYVDMRYSIIPDAEEMARRWGPRGLVAYLSTPAVYKNFKEPAAYLKKIDNMPPRTVDIIRVQRDGSANTYQVDVDLYQLEGGQRWSKRSRRLMIAFAYAKSRAYLGRTFSNPNGLVVTFVNDSPLKTE